MQIYSSGCTLKISSFNLCCFIFIGTYCASELWSGVVVVKTARLLLNSSNSILGNATKRRLSVFTRTHHAQVNQVPRGRGLVRLSSWERRQRACGCQPCIRLKPLQCELTPANTDVKAGTTPQSTTVSIKPLREAPEARHTRNSRNPLP